MLKNPADANILLNNIRTAAGPPEPQRAQNPDRVRYKHDEEYKVFIDALSKIFHVGKTKCCSVTLVGKLMQHSFLAVDKCRITYNDDVQYAEVFVDIISRGLINAEMQADSGYIKAGAFAFSKTNPQAKPLNSGKRPKALLEEVCKLISDFTDLLHTPDNDLGDELNSKDNLALFENIKSELGKAKKHFDKCVKQHQKMRVEDWEQIAQQLTPHLSGIERVLNIFFQPDGSLNHELVSKLGGVKAQEIIRKTVANYSEQNQVTDYISDYALFYLLTSGDMCFEVDKEHLRFEEGGKLVVHAEMQQIKYVINDSNTIPYIGVSLLCCGMCYHIIEYESKKAGKAISDIIPGTHGIFYPENWSVPEFCLETEESWQNLSKVELLGRGYCDDPNCVDLYYSILES